MSSLTRATNCGSSAGAKPTKEATQSVSERADKPVEAPKQEEIEKQIVQRKNELEEEYKALMEEKEQIDTDSEYWLKRYNTRQRKPRSRAKLKELKEQEAEWQKKYKSYEEKKIDLQRLELKKEEGKTDSPPQK